MRLLYSVLIVTAVSCSLAPTSDGVAQDVPVPEYAVDPFLAQGAAAECLAHPGRAHHDDR